jgi:hypothetical protein
VIDPNFQTNLGYWGWSSTFETPFTSPSASYPVTYTDSTGNFLSIGTTGVIRIGPDTSALDLANNTLGDDVDDQQALARTAPCFDSVTNKR